MKSRGPTRRIIYDEKYYRLKKISQDEKFLKRIEGLKEQCKKFGCPPPHRADELVAWLEKIKKIATGVIRNPKHESAVASFIKGLPGSANGASTLTAEEYKELEKRQNGILAPAIFSGEFDKILEEFRLDPKDMNNQRWFEGFFFFDQKEYQRSLYEIHYRPKADATGSWPPGLWIRFFGYTKISDISKKQIALFQKYMPGYVRRRVPKDEYIAIRNDATVACYLGERDKKDPTLRERRSPENAIYRTIVKVLHKEYPELNEDLVKTVVANWRRENRQQQGKP